MKYKGSVFGADAELVIENEGVRLAERFLNYADIQSLIPVNHRVRIITLDGETIEVSMLGFSYDGFWEELTEQFGKRSLDSLFVEEKLIMMCEGEYQMPCESGRGKIALYSDAVCVLPQSCNAVRIPLCYVDRLWLDGYQLHISMGSGEQYIVGKMGYDTKPFTERAEQAADAVKSMRSKAVNAATLHEPFTEKGLFRTRNPEQYWNAAFGDGVCAVELFTGEDAATYLYRFEESRDVFLAGLERAMEAVGTHREVIYMAEEQLSANPLYRMTVQRTPAVLYLRARSNGRLIHGKNHALRLKEYLGL